VLKPVSYTHLDVYKRQVRDSLNALVRGDIELAHSVLQRDDQVDRLRDQLFRELLTYMMENSAVVFSACLLYTSRCV